MEEYRFSICKMCGIYNSIKQQCNSSLAINPETNDVCGITSAGNPKLSGYIRGCGCFIPAKIKNENNHCPANKW